MRKVTNLGTVNLCSARIVLFEKFDKENISYRELKTDVVSAIYKMLDQCEIKTIDIYSKKYYVKNDFVLFQEDIDWLNTRRPRPDVISINPVIVDNLIKNFELYKPKYDGYNSFLNKCIFEVFSNFKNSENIIIAYPPSYLFSALSFTEGV